MNGEEIEKAGIYAMNDIHKFIVIYEYKYIDDEQSARCDESTYEN